MSSALLSMGEAARVIGVRRQAILIAIQKGTLEFTRFGPYKLITPEEAERYRQRSQHGADMHHRNPKYRVWGKAKNKLP